MTKSASHSGRNGKMKHFEKKASELRQEYFLKGLFVGIGATALIGAIGGYVTYRILRLRRENVHDIRLYKFNMESGISPDTAVDIATPSFKDASDKIEKDYEMQLKEYEEAEEALKHITENY